MSTQHTSGPWVVQIQPTRITIGQGSPANITKSVISHQFSFAGSAEEIKARADLAIANARLIAAAPDMFAILKKIQAIPVTEPGRIVCLMKAINAIVATAEAAQ